MTNLNWPSIPVVGPLSKILVCVHSSPGWYSTFVRPSRHVIGCCCTIWGLPSAVKVPGFSFCSVSKSTRWLIWYESYHMGLSHLMAHILGLKWNMGHKIFYSFFETILRSFHGLLPGWICLKFIDKKRQPQFHFEKPNIFK